jgi:hypothetical protein
MSNYDTNTTVVKQVQTAINAAGYSPPLATDGAYGPKTIAGVKWFQAQHGLAQDGIIGDQTVAATIAPTLSGVGAATALVPPVISLPTVAQAQSVLSAFNPPSGASGAITAIPPPGVMSPSPLGLGGLGLGGLGGALGGVQAPATSALMFNAAAPHSAVLAAPAAAAAMPAWLGTVLGIAAGAMAGGLFAGALTAKAIVGGGLLGGVVGGAWDLVRGVKPAAPVATMHGEAAARMHARTHARTHPTHAGVHAKPHAHARMHGDTGVDWVPGTPTALDVNFDDTEGTVVAGDIGMPASYKSMMG